MNPRQLEGRLRAWQTFRDIAHAARVFAAGRSSHWGQLQRSAHRYLREVLAGGRTDEPPPAPPVIVGFGTDQGLCGSLNRRVSTALCGHGDAHPGATMVAVGQRLVEAADREASWIQLGAPASSVALDSLAQQVAALALSGAVMRPVHLVFPTSADVAGHVTVSIDTEAVAAADCPGFSVLDGETEVARRSSALLLRARVVLAAATAVYVENLVRLAVMTRAQGVADRQVTEQTRRLRALRSESITQEMLEVLGGARTRRAQTGPVAPEGRT